MFKEHLPGIYVLKSNNKNSGALCEKCLKFVPYCSASIFGFENENAGWDLVDL